MLSEIELEWRGLRRGRPGRRFRDRYDAVRRRRRSFAVRAAGIAAAVAAMAIGFVLVFVPGPAVLFFLVAGMLLAAESRAVARMLDRGELGWRAASAGVRRRWQGLSTGGKGGVALVVAAGAVALAGAVYVLLLR